MKKTLLTLTLVLLFAFGASAAGVPSPFSFYAGGAISVPSDDFGTAYKSGWHGFAGGGYKFAPKFQIIGKVEMHNFSSDLSSLGLDGGATKFTMFGTDGKFTLGVPLAPISPYILGGIGIAHVTTDDFSGSDLLSTAVADLSNTLNPGPQNKMYWNVGTGIEIKSGPAWSFFAQGRYVSVSADSGSYKFIPLTLGVKFF